MLYRLNWKKSIHNPWKSIHGFCPAKQIVLVQLLRSTFHSTLAIYTGTTADRHGNKAPGKCSATPLSSRNLDKQTFPQGQLPKRTTTLKKTRKVTYSYSLQVQQQSMSHHVTLSSCSTPTSQACKASIRTQLRQETDITLSLTLS